MGKYGKRVVAHISRAAFLHNLEVACGCSAGGIIAVLKANAYGHGAVELAQWIKGDSRVAFIGLANLAEAQELRAAGIRKEILLLSPCLPEEREEAVRAGFHVSISSGEELLDYEQIGGRLQKRALAHVVLDTGMGRIGFLEREWLRAIEWILKCRSIEVEGIWSHFPCAEETGDFTKNQIGIFARMVEIFRAKGLQPRWVHLGNSAGILAYGKEMGKFCNLVRPGLMLYGASPMEKFQSFLKPVMEIRTRVLLVRDLPKGSSVSYGRTFVAEKEMRTATLSIGYEDGYLRHISESEAYVLIKGKRCPLLGRVTMDQIIVDVSALGRDVGEGDEAIILGTQGDKVIFANTIAKWAGTIAWEFFTAVGNRVKRSFEKE